MDDPEYEENEQPAAAEVEEGAEVERKLAVLAPIGLALAAIGCLLGGFTGLSVARVGPFPGFLERLSGLVGFYTSDLMYVLGVAGAVLLLAGMVSIYQSSQ